MNILLESIRQLNLYSSILFKKNKVSLSIPITNDVIIYDTSLYSDNLGDNIINYYCDRIFDELQLNIIDRIPTHNESEKTYKDYIKIVTGTNILNSHMNYGSWRIPKDLSGLDSTLFLGVGSGEYYDEVNHFTKILYKEYINKTYLHSVRDRYTEEKLRSNGIENVLYTACPTMWSLNEEFCKGIPTKKASNVVTTITDYNRDYHLDWYMLDTLLTEYNKVYIWIQGDKDLEYLSQYSKFSQLNIIENSFEKYTDFLENMDDLDYVGTRLHAGIHALNYKKRSIIISIDNRAKEIAKNTNLPIIERNCIISDLKNKINSQFITNIDLPTENIQMWKNQFR